MDLNTSVFHDIGKEYHASQVLWFLCEREDLNSKSQTYILISGLSPLNGIGKVA